MIFSKNIRDAEDVFHIEFYDAKLIDRCQKNLTFNLNSYQL